MNVFNGLRRSVFIKNALDRIAVVLLAGYEDQINGQANRRVEIMESIDSVVVVVAEESRQLF